MSSMSNVTLFLGPVAFQDFEIPAGINIGGDQRLAIHRLLDGTRVIDALGRDDSDISFSGVFSGDAATLRARTIDQMRVSGLPICLTWDVFFYAVIIKKFEADYRSGWWVPYRITCAVVRDEASSDPGPEVLLSNNVLGDVTIASTLASTVGTDLSITRIVISEPDVAVRGTALHSSALAGLTNSASKIALGISEAETILVGTSWSAVDNVGYLACSLNNVVLAAQQVCFLFVANAYIGRSILNIANAST